MGGGARWFMPALLFMPAIALARDDAGRALAGRIPGRSRDCISLSSVQGPQVLSDGSILYRQSGKRIWRTTAVGSCRLRPLDTLIVDVFGGQLCRNDRFRTVTPNITIPSGYCRFGRFTPYDKP